MYPETLTAPEPVATDYSSIFGNYFDQDFHNFSERSAKREASLVNTRLSEPPTTPKADSTRQNTPKPKVKSVEWIEEKKRLGQVDKVQAEIEEREARLYSGYGQRRRERYLMREAAGEVLWERGVTHRIQACGRVLVNNEGAELKVGETDHGPRAFFGNVATCGSASTCPVCACKIATSRQKSLAAILQAVLADVDIFEVVPGSKMYQSFNKYTVLFTTHTVRHSSRMGAGEVWDAFQSIHRRVYNGNSWKQFVNRSGWVGSVRFMEATHGSYAGWHIHSHTIHIFENAKARAGYGYEDSAKWLAEKWYKASGKQGKKYQVSLEYGTHSELITAEEGIAKYLNKMGLTVLTGEVADGLALEATGGAYKKGRVKTNLTPMQILARITHTREKKASGVKLTRRERRNYVRWTRVFQEWAEVSKGRRLYIVSGDIKELGEKVGVAKDVEEMENPDERLAAEGEGMASKRLATVPLMVWRSLNKTKKVPEILDAAEDVEENPVYLYGMLRGVGLSDRYMGPLIQLCEEWDEAQEQAGCESAAEPAPDAEPSLF